MATLSDFSDEPEYTIKKVSEQTGIRPVTLRAWERRYGVISPQRAENRYRQYSERDIEILRWLKSRIDRGLSISSAAAELHKMRASGNWAKAVPAAPSARIGRYIRSPEIFKKKLYTALIRHDEARASKLLTDLLGTVDLPTIFRVVLAPCLEEIGDGWLRGEISVPTEHYASAFLRGKLLALLQSLPSRRGAPLLLVGSAPGEQHEIGALMLAVLLRSQRYRVEYLGSDIPIIDLVDYAKFEKPAMIILAATSETAALGLKPMQALLRPLDPAPAFGYGGRAFNLNLQLVDLIEGIFLGETFDAALETVRRLFPLRK